MRIDANSWYYSPDHRQLCQVIEAQTLWGETTCQRVAEALTQDVLLAPIESSVIPLPLLVMRVEGGGHE